MSTSRRATLRAIAGSVLGLLGTACSDSTQYQTSACALIDVSGTYARQKANVVRIVKAGIVPKLNAGDSLFAIAIDSNSYEEDNLIAQLVVDYVPSKAAEQKLAFASRLDAFAKQGTRSSHTDISGAMMLCADRLRATGSGKRAMFVFSDMKEDLRRGLKRDFKRDEFVGVHVAALNVIKLNTDAVDPQVYRGRLQGWEKRLLGRGAARWEVVLDPTRIPEFLDRVR